ncbi:MAG: J domain-containing protein [Planctomycetota bacterium]
MTSKDPYKILGVARGAAQDEIKRTYRQLAKKFHPDRNPGDKSAEQRFKEVQAAYEVLGDPQRRAQYDRFGAGGPRPEFHQWSSGGGAPFGGGIDFDNLGDLTSIFEQFFSRGQTRGPRRAARRPHSRGADIEHTVELSFEEALRGTSREVLLKGGPRSEHIKVRIPAGVANGQRIRVKEKGQDGQGGRGDLMIHCHVQAHRLFRRDGRDILLDLPLTFSEAALGANIEIPTPDGPTVVKVPAGTSSGTKLRLRGRGVRLDRSGDCGDLYAVVRIQVPKILSPRARELLAELDNITPLKPRADWPTSV